MSARPPRSIDPRDALDAIGLLPDVEIDVADAAIQLARVDAPRADWQAAREALSGIARDAILLARDLAGADVARCAEALGALLTGEHGFHGDTETYDDPANANLIRVVERRKGLPVALGVIWLHAARSAGWVAQGVNFPGHFLVALAGKGRQRVLDVFDGGVALDARDLRALIRRVEGPRAELRPGVLQPMATRSVLLRLQNNVKVRRLEAGNLARALVAVEDMLRIAPDNATLWREAALMHQRLGQVGAALRCFDRFLEIVPKGEAATRVRAAMEELRARLN